ERGAPDADVHGGLAADGLAEPLERLHARIVLGEEVGEVGVDVEPDGRREGERSEKDGKREDRERVAHDGADERAERVEESVHGWGYRARKGRELSRGSGARSHVKRRRKRVRLRPSAGADSAGCNRPEGRRYLSPSPRSPMPPP